MSDATAGVNGNHVLEHALAYLEQGISVISIHLGGGKNPAITTWDPYKDTKGKPGRLPTQKELRGWFRTGLRRGIAGICGRVSGGLELIDFDTDADTIYPQWCELVEAECPGLVDRLCIVRSPRPGYHVRYRCSGEPIPPNMDLAKDPSRAVEKEQTLIQTRGEGGYGLLPGGHPDAHETRQPYTWHSGPRLTDTVPEITADEREVLIRCARFFDRSPPKVDPKPYAGRPDELRPGDDFDLNGPDWPEIPGFEWRLARTACEVRLWCRPGKDRGWSATTGYCKGQHGEDLLKIFTSNAPPFEAGKCYGKFRAFTFLNHGGDYSAAARELAAQGYGSRHHTNGQQQRASDSPPPPEPWDTLIPIGGEYHGPAYPLDCLTAPWLRDWVEAEAEATQTPPDLSAMLGKGICGAGLAGKVRVQVRPGWSEPTNIFSVSALSPGERKSAVFAAALEPVQMAERDEIRRAAPDLAELASGRRVLEQRLKALEGKAGRAKTAEEADSLAREASEVACRLAACAVPDSPKLYCDDVTPEKLANLLARQQGRMLQASAEGTVFEIVKGRYSETANFDVYLKGHSGDPLRIDRVSRADDTIDSPALSVVLAVQPDVVQGLASDASLRGRGFLARFLYSLPVSRVGVRKIKPPPVPESVAEAYRRNVRRLWELRGRVRPDGTPEPDLLIFTTDADELLASFQAWLEPQLADGEPLSYMAGWALKLPGAVARLAGILHAANGRAGEPPSATAVEAETVCAAVRLGRDYLLPHARAAFALLGADPRQEDAKRVVSWLGKADLSESLNCLKGCRTYTVSRSEIHEGVFGGTRRAEQVEAVVELLVKHNYLRPVESGQPLHRRGRQPSQRYDINPAGIRQSSG